MRTLKFNVRAQRIEKDLACDFKGLVAGSEGYLQAEFKTDDAWKGCALAAGFTVDGQEYGAAVRDGACEIPPQALKGHVFGVLLKGRRPGYKIETNTVYVRQEVKNYGNG